MKTFCHPRFKTSWESFSKFCFKVRSDNWDQLLSKHIPTKTQRPLSMDEARLVRTCTSPCMGSSRQDTCTLPMLEMGKYCSQLGFYTVKTSHLVSKALKPQDRVGSHSSCQTQKALHAQLSVRWPVNVALKYRNATRISRWNRVPWH